MGKKNYVTISQAAKLMGVHRQTVWNWIRREELEAYRVGNIFRIIPESLTNVTEYVTVKNKKKGASPKGNTPHLDNVSVAQLKGMHQEKVGA